MTNTDLCETYDVIYPHSEDALDQDEEWIEVRHGSSQQKIRIHDYDIMYSIPGLYEEVVYNKLKCRSPEVVTDLLAEAIRNSDTPEKPLTILDFGAGNGIVAEYVSRKLPCNEVIGVDIIPEAKEAAYRDRPEVYDDYFVLDFCSLSAEEQATLEEKNIDTLITVAALGFHDISTKAFLEASKLVSEGGWIAFNIRDKFLSDKDSSGFHDTIEEMMHNMLEIVSTKRYCHRESLCGEKLYYYAIVARKIAHTATEKDKMSLSDLCSSSR